VVPQGVAPLCRDRRSKRLSNGPRASEGLTELAARTEGLQPVALPVAVFAAAGEVAAPRSLDGNVVIPVVTTICLWAVSGVT